MAFRVSPGIADFPPSARRACTQQQVKNAKQDITVDEERKFRE
jgi:hypothetical protein